MSFRHCWVSLLCLFSLVGCDSAVEPSPNPVPVLRSVEPDLLTQGETSATVTLTGLAFVEGAKAFWNGSERPTEYDSPTRLRISLSAADLDEVGEVAVSAANPEPGGGASESLPVAIGHPTPRIESISPTSAEAVLTSELTLHVYGSRFAPGPDGAVVRWNDIPLPTTVLTSTELRATVGDHLLQEGDVVHITASNPSPGGGVSAPLAFALLPLPPPEITALSPRWVVAGSSSFTLTIFGSAFSVDPTVTWNGQVRPATIVRHGWIELQLGAEDVAIEGSGEIVVLNPGRGEASAQLAVFQEAMAFGAHVVAEMWGGGEIVASSIDGSHHTRLPVPGGGFRVDASPVDSKVVFHGGGSGSQEARIFVADPYAGSIRRLTGPKVEDLLSQEQWAKFSADGRSIYFMGSRRANGRWELWKANVDGSEAQRLEQEPRAFNGYPAPSPAGNRLVYSASTSSSPGSSGSLEVLDLNTGQASSLGVRGGTSRWSPQDDWIAYVNGSWQLRLIRPDGTEDHELLPGEVFESGFDWSPDGKFIIATDREGNAVLVTVESGGIEPLPGLGRIHSIAWYGP